MATINFKQFHELVEQFNGEIPLKQICEQEGVHYRRYIRWRSQEGLAPRRQRRTSVALPSGMVEMIADGMPLATPSPIATTLHIEFANGLKFDRTEMEVDSLVKFLTEIRSALCLSNRLTGRLLAATWTKPDNVDWISKSAMTRWRNCAWKVTPNGNKPGVGIIVGPLLPWGPVYPNRPIIGPIRPPVQLIDPIKPINTFEPYEPVDPILPDKPLEPVDPIDPIKPIEPIFPDKPIVVPITPIDPPSAHYSSKPM